MRHGKKDNHLGRTSQHRKALLANLASSLITSEKKRIVTTLAKAKELRKFVEPLVTRSRDNTTHSRRVVFSYLQNKEAVNELFTGVASKIGDRPGGYTRILKLGPRDGDNAELALIEFVDYNEFIQGPAKKATRRRKKSAKKSSKGAVEAAAETATEGAKVVKKAAKKAAKKSSKKSSDKED